jgi:hypothetical protein
MLSLNERVEKYEPRQEVVLELAYIIHQHTYDALIQEEK